MAKVAMNFKFPLYIKYDRESFKDGFGSQAVRIAGIYSIAQKFCLKYEHEDDICISGIRELMGQQYDEDEFFRTIDWLRNLIHFPSAKKKASVKQRIVRIHDIGLRVLFKYIFLSILQPNRILLLVSLPFGIVDRDTSIYSYSQPILLENLQKLALYKPSSRVVLHVRTAEHSPDKNRPQMSSQYYEKSLKTISQEYDLDITHLIVHTDFYEEDLHKIDSSPRVKEIKNYLDNLALDYKVVVKHYAPIKELLEDFASAKVLIMSRSSLPYFGGLLNRNLVIIPKNHGHSPLKTWIAQ